MVRAVGTGLADGHERLGAFVTWLEAHAERPGGCECGSWIACGTGPGGACPFRFRCLGCGHFRSDPSYLPELRDYLDTLLRDRERIRAATELDDWARTEAMPSDAEITRLRELIRRVEHDLDALDENDRRQIEEAVRVVRATRQTVHLGLPTTRSPALHPNLEDPA